MRKGTYVISKKGKWIIDTNHSIERMAQRGNYSEDQIEEMFESILSKYWSQKDRFDRDRYNQEYFFFLSKYMQGFVIAHRRDFKKVFKGNHFVLVTVYPQGVHAPKRYGTPVVTIT